MIRQLLLLSVLSAMECQSGPTPPVPPSPPVPVPTVTANGGAAPLPPTPSPDCSTACDRLKALGCIDAANTDAGASCDDVCQNALDSGVVGYPVSCVSSAASCAAAARCF